MGPVTPNKFVLFWSKLGSPGPPADFVGKFQLEVVTTRISPEDAIAGVESTKTFPPQSIFIDVTVNPVNDAPELDIAQETLGMKEESPLSGVR